MTPSSSVVAVRAPAVTDEEELQNLYNWVDEIPLSRPKRNIARDFADGVLMAEIVSNAFPRLVDIHNYSPANSLSQKCYNWNTLNQKTFRRMGFRLHQDDIDDVANAVQGAIEKVLLLVQKKLACFKKRQMAEGYNSPGASPEYSFDDDTSKLAPSRLRAAVKAHQTQDVDKLLQRQEALELLLTEREETISELRQTVSLMSDKISKLEQLLRIKDSKIQHLTAKIG
eukprot:GHVL01043755.1.p1 GENE.GHVL01043755.1~~GHVL01043755.1.p1  ORF type:complete len:227 (+),score=49.33 GHVL01043755.1:57-737(+)